jgi:DNA-binding NarL/FixJ family response regulator
MGNEIEVLLVDDEPSVRCGLRMRVELEPDLAVVGEASNGLEAIQSAQALHPDVVVMDVEMPRMDGITATRRLREAAPLVSVVMLSIYDDASARERARAAGAASFVGKQEDVERLFDAIRRAAASRRKGEAR